MAKVFDSKLFNGEVFLQYLNRIPDTNLNELLKSGVLRINRELAAQLPEQTGGNYIVRPYKDLISGDPDNYDGQTDINSTSTDTYKQGIIVVGRAKGFTEKDFSWDITGVDFMSNVATQLAKYWENTNQKILLSVLKGIFGIADLADHIYDVKDVMGVTSLNSAIQAACGDNKKIFSLAIMHSYVATQLENANLLDYLKYTDAAGIQRNLNLATWNGRMVIVDDSVPVRNVEAAGDEEAYVEYTTYVLGLGAIDYANVGVKVPVEMSRDASKNGGEDTLYSRERILFAPAGISFCGIDKIASNSPTNAELEDAANWELVKNSNGTKTIDTKAIPFVAIKSRN